MKRILIITIAALIAFPALSQNEENKEEIKTIFGKVDSHGGYWAFNLNYSQLDGENAMFIGGRGAWVIGHGFAIGMGGGGFFNEYHYNEDLGENVNLQGGYGGLCLEGIILPKFPAHISIPVFLGVGGVSYTSDYYDDTNNSLDAIQVGDAFLIVEPGIEIELNLVKAVRLGFGISYRYTSDLDMNSETTGIPKDVLHGLTYGATIKFGKF